MKTAVREKPIRILRIIARLNIGGPAIQALTLTRMFSEGPYQTLLLCGRVGPHEGDMTYLADSKGVEPLMLSALAKDISIAQDAISLVQVRETIRKFNPHIIHTHTAKAGTIGRLGGMSFNFMRRPRLRIKLVHTFHGHVFHDYFSPFKTRFFIEIERLLARFTDRIIVISPSQKEDICNTYRIASPSKVRVVPLGFDLSPYTAQPEINESDNQGPCRIGIIGRLTSVKNHRLLLEAARDLKSQGKDHYFRFLVIGDGELAWELKRYALKLEVDNVVRFLGWRKDMPSLYRSLNAVVLTSLNEGTPVALIEAMAAGKPVIATDVGGVKDLLGAVEASAGNGYRFARRGILISSGDRESLAGALLYVLENRASLNLMTERARSFSLRQYALERLVKDLDSLYRELTRS
ncbi:MAG: glycosyltransferase [Deltaproteobacteria bacterium]|nr:glycosyltransferase [Deltaproteobacteria bacterium]